MCSRNCALAALLLVACNVTGQAQSPALATEAVTDGLIASAPGGEWLSYGRDYGEQRFSPLTRINDASVKDLGLAWSVDLETARGQEATPLMHGGVLYVSTAWSIVKAFDAATGKLLWSYDPGVPRETLVRVCCDAVNRGVALYGDKVYVAALDGRLIAIDRKSGKPVWSRVVVPDQKNYSITGAPRVVKGKVLIGSAGSEYRARGYLAALDAQTGEEVWRFHTVPGDPAKGFENAAMEKAAETWTGRWWEFGGGGTVWDSITYDPVTNLVLFGTGNAEPWNPATAGRAGDSLYTSSIVAVNADTGEYAWHFQETPEDRWDYDSDAQIIVADLMLDGKSAHVVMHAPKNGYFYVLEAGTGRFLSGTPFTRLTWATAIDAVTGRPTINPEARYEQTGKMYLGTPGIYGAHTWHPMSFSPQTGLVYIPTNETPFPYLADKGFAPSDLGGQMGLSAVPTPADKEARSAVRAMNTGALIAWDPVARKEAWRVPYHGPSNGGTLATAGNLVFQGTAGGEFVAYSADKGQRLWSFPAQTGIIAAPISYAVGGEQYVAVVVGWGGLWDLFGGVLADKSGPTRNISRVLVFRLGATGALPAPPPMADRVLDPPPFTGTPVQLARGGTVYARYCMFCHGDAAISGGMVPDLRHSATLNDGNAIKAVVVDGALEHNGMVSFREVVTAADAEAIRQYLISRANEDKTLGK